ncbi:metal ABC transporter permease [Vallitalea sp.]|jgi:zinc transport system permease protein|uniref:metal ABC transporter permease n=1 Tax=Vallitalea sp. TaxID=1882829 RepID=UPI0025F61B8B|nr:metal ABC transporter permease [Vallitalea sp.]MCT4687579.1 metal ABC transporter permease [Vallitalea sp.]
MLEAICKYGFMQNAIVSIILASIVCGIIGTIVVEKKLVMMSGGIAHASFGGIGLGFLLGFEPIIGGLLFAIISAVAIVSIKRKTNTTSDTIIGMLWSLGMALGILFISLTPGYPPDMTTYLFGDILTVSVKDIYLMVILTLFILISSFALFNYIKSYLFDEVFLRSKGVNTTFLEYFLFILIALSIVILIKVVGIILVITLLTVPPAISKLITYNFNIIILLSSIMGIILCFLGLVFSYYFNIPSGATIIILSSVAYLITALIKSKK